jgi:hypothetical protein
MLYSLHNTPVKLPSTQTVTTYLLVMGVLATFALAFMLLLFLAYLCQLLMSSVCEIAATFNTLDPIVRLLIIALAGVLVAWNFSSRMKVVRNGQYC